MPIKSNPEYSLGVVFGVEFDVCHRQTAKKLNYWKPNPVKLFRVVYHTNNVPINERGSSVCVSGVAATDDIGVGYLLILGVVA